MTYYTKLNGQYVQMPKEELIKEHEELTDLLDKTADELEAERDKQSKELEGYKAI